MISYKEIEHLVYNKNFFVVTQETEINLYVSAPYKVLVNDKQTNHETCIMVSDINQLNNVLDYYPNDDIYLIVPRSLYNHVYTVLRNVVHNNISQIHSNYNPVQYLYRNIYELPLLCFYNINGESLNGLDNYYDEDFSDTFNLTTPLSHNVYFYSITLYDFNYKTINYLKLFDIFNDDNIDVFPNSLLKIKDLSVQQDYTKKNNYSNEINGLNFMNDFIGIINKQFPKYSMQLIL
ncbi:hypothetical protein PBI_SCTP2_287 [Salicola phage SCTP-2]|nr:hypothetical protein PBI_SCTP2_287 [Salicola phage SCTP-2]